MPSHRRLHLAASLTLLGTALQAAPNSPAPGASRPITPEQFQAMQHITARAGVQAQHGPGDIIPPCIIAYGYTNHGVTDRHGYLIVGQPLFVPKWTTEVATPKPSSQRR